MSAEQEAQAQQILDSLILADGQTSATIETATAELIPDSLLGLPYAAIEWSAISKANHTLVANEKTSIYKIARQLGWPSNRDTHGHVINYIRQSAEEQEQIQIVENNYLVAGVDMELEIPAFSAYMTYIKSSTNPEFQQYYNETLQQYDYPPVITDLEKQLLTTTVSYKNPVTEEIGNVTVAETLYGCWFMDKIQLAKDYFDNKGTLKGFQPTLLQGITDPVHSMETQVRRDYEAYSTEEWEGLSWEAKVNYFELGLQTRLQQERIYGLRKHYKDMVRANGGEDVDARRVAHTVTGEEVYDDWRKEVLGWKDGWMNNLTDVESKINEYIDKRDDTNDPSKIAAYTTLIDTYEAITPILTKWENVDYTPTKEDIVTMKRYREYLRQARVSFWRPTTKSLEEIYDFLQLEITKIPEQALGEEGIEKKLLSYHEVANTTFYLLMSIDEDNGSEEYVPKLAEFEAMEILYQQLEEFEDRRIPKLKKKHRFSPLRGEFQLEKYQNTRGKVPVDYIQDALKQIATPFSSREGDDE